MEKIRIISKEFDLVQCSKCKSFVKKNQWKSHKKEHQYDEDGRYA